MSSRNQEALKVYLQGDDLKVTFHAGERFLQRVFGFTAYTKKQIVNAIRLIEKDIRDIDYRNNKYIPLPTFPNFYGVVVNKALVTVIPKEYSRCG